MRNRALQSLPSPNDSGSPSMEICSVLADTSITTVRTKSLLQRLGNPRKHFSTESTIFGSKDWKGSSLAVHLDFEPKYVVIISQSPDKLQ